jgi:hypothetical protein
VRQIQILLQFLLPPRMCLQRAPSSRRTHAPTPRKHDAKWSGTFLDRLLFLKDLPAWCRYHGKGGVYAHDTIHPVIREKIPTQCQGLYAEPKTGKDRVSLQFSCAIS